MEAGNPENRQRLVWAKVSGYPWWPALIVHQENKENLKKETNDTEERRLVNFIGHKSHSYLTKEKIKDYNENYEECSKTKNPVLLKAVALANDLKNNLPLCEEEKPMIFSHFKRNFASKIQKMRKTISTIKRMKLKRSRIQEISGESHATKAETDFSQESFDLDEIRSTNPFQRISRSIIKELNIKTTLNSGIKKEKNIVQKPRNIKKIQISQPENPEKSVLTSNFSSNYIQKECEATNSEKKDFEHNLEKCLLKMSTKRTKNVISMLGKLLGSYHDHNFSAEELFSSDIPKIFKTMQALLKDLKNPELEFPKIQLESILNHIKEKVLNEMMNNKIYTEKIFVQNCKTTKLEEEEPKIENGKNQEIKIHNEKLFVQNCKTTKLEEEPTDIICNNNRTEKLFVQNCKTTKLEEESSNLNLKSSENPLKAQELIKKNSEKTTTSTVTTTTQKLEKKPKRVLIKKRDELKKKSVKKPNLRKKICLKLAKILQNNYNAEKLGSQNLALAIEGKVRNEFPLMNKEYKSYIKMVFTIIKKKKLIFEQLNDIFSLDFKHIGPILKELNNFEFEANGEKKV